MTLSEYLAAVRRVIAMTAADAVMYTDELLTESLRQALREYAEMAPPVETLLTVTSSGQEQDLLALPGADGQGSAITDMQQLVLIAWPWDANPLTGSSTDGLSLRERTRWWRSVRRGVVWIEDGEPAAGDLLLVSYRRRQTVEDLDGASQTTVLPEHEGLLALGAAGWAAELHYRQVAEAVKGPTAEQIQRMYTWGHLRLNEFRNGLKDLPKAAPVVRPAWGSFGL